MRLITTLMLVAILLAGLSWATLALWFDGPSSRVLATALCVPVILSSVLFAARVRPLLSGLLVAIVPVAVVALWWASLTPSNFRHWTPDVARIARANFHDSSVTIQNVRDFNYRSESDYDQRWETRTYDLDRVRGVDLFLSFWGPTHFAHTIASWDVGDGRHVAISIETRKEQGETYSALRGFFRQYELYYVVADERDLVGLRTNYRGEQVYLYHITVPASEARALLVDYLVQINHLAEHAEWYNALTHNCTTTIRGHAQNVGTVGGWDWRILANGHLDELLYQRSQIDTRLPLSELRARSNITERAKTAGDSEEFSTRIREGLPDARKM
jgi:hypothetical protein